MADFQPIEVAVAPDESFVPIEVDFSPSAPPDQPAVKSAKTTAPKES